MADLLGGAKKLGVDRNQRTAVIAVGLASFVLVFSIFFSLRLYEKQKFQDVVICQLTNASKNIKTSSTNLTNLTSKFNEFNETEALLGKEKQGGTKNSVIVFKALPPEYKGYEIQLAWNNFRNPGYGTGLDGDGTRGTGQGYKDGSITVPGAAPGAVAPSGEGEPVVPEGVQIIRFEAQVAVRDLQELDKLLNDLDNFIMPVKILSIDITYNGEESEEPKGASVSLSMQTYVQAEKNIQYPSPTITQGQLVECSEGGSGTPLPEATDNEEPAATDETAESQ